VQRSSREPLPAGGLRARSHGEFWGAYYRKVMRNLGTFPRGLAHKGGRESRIWEMDLNSGRF
jgi:hypothetical protein